MRSLGAAQLASGKDHAQENFPVASWLVRADCRAPIMAFYRFARASDDIADHETASAEEKLHLLAEMRSGLTGQGTAEAMALGEVMRARGLDMANPLDLLDAFLRDCTINRYADWAGLIGYCRLSAMPVGRFVLDVHGEDRATWPLSDALCAALQVINHLQDCGKDYRALDRVYIPTDLLDAAGVPISALGEAKSSPALRQVIVGLAQQTKDLLADATPFASTIRDFRLSAEVALIHHLASDLVELLLHRDPLSERVHHGKWQSAGLAIEGLLRHGWRRMMM